MQAEQLKNIIEAALLVAGKPVPIDTLMALFEEDRDRPGRDDIRNAISLLEQDYQERSTEIKQVASGYRIQVKGDYSDWVSRLWTEKPSRYSRALLETLALIAYRQPVTRAEIEDVRGVSVSSNIIRTLLEREWVRVVGHRDVPGKPAMYGTTREFLDYFNLKTLADLPTLAEIRDIDEITGDLFKQEESSTTPDIGIEGQPDHDYDLPDIETDDVLDELAAEAD